MPVISLAKFTFERCHTLANIPLIPPLQIQMNPIPSLVRFILLSLWMTQGLRSGMAQSLSLSWQGLPTAYSEAKGWTIIGQSEQGLWFFRNSKKDLRIEHRNIRMQLKQSVRIPDYLLQSEKITLLNTDTGAQLLFDLFNPSAGEHGLFVSGIQKDSSKTEAAQLIFETSGNQDQDNLHFEVIMDEKGKGGWIVHQKFAPDQINLHYLRVPEDSSMNDSLNLDLRATQLGSGDQSVFTKIHKLTQIREHLFAFLFQFKASPKDRRKTLWGLGLANFKENWIRSISLNRNDLAEQRLFVSRIPGKDTINIHGYALDDRNLWPTATITYRIPIPERNQTPELISLVNMMDSETNRHLLNLRANEGNTNRVDESFADLRTHTDGSVTLGWRRQFKSIETMVQYSQGMPMYREITRYHANDWVITRINFDGSHRWSQIVPMNLTSIDRTHQLRSFMLVAGKAILLVGYQNMNNRVVPYILQTLPDGHVINADLENRLKGLAPQWDHVYTVDQNNLIVPGRHGSRAGLLYLHCHTP